MTDNIQTLDLNDLRTARVIFRTQHLSQAAQELGKTPSAMSHALRRLRVCFGDELLVRQGRGWVLTPLAEQVYQELERNFTTLARFATSGVNFRPHESQRRFVIATTDYTELVILPDLMAQMRERSPRCAIDVVRSKNASLELESGRVDLLLVPKFELPDDHLIMKELFDDHLVLVGRAETLRSIETVKDFSRISQSLISPRGGIHTELDDALHVLGLKRHIALSSPSFVVPAMAAATSNLITAMPRRIAAVLAERFGLAMAPHPVTTFGFTMTMIWHPRMRADIGHKWMRQLVVEVCREIRERGGSAPCV